MVFGLGSTGGKNRRVLADIDYYPTTNELFEMINSYEGSYKTNKDFYQTRDKALASILYLGQLRRSEVHRLIKEQFKEDPFRIVAVKLSKSQKTNRKTGEVITRKDAYRKEIPIPLKGTLGKLGQFVQDYLPFIDEKDRLFPFSDKAGRVDQIIKEMLGVPPHWERAFGENMLYELFDNDLIAVANHVQVDPRTLAKYIHRTPEKYLKKLR